ncbi:MAG: hypothetical protein HY002_15365, partial [Candidatus Rokubacteria bacterium]|nr:hypothetical protein [Candidatus Rokubacteria bacterium]
LFLRWRRHGSFVVFYLGLGVLFNVHPVSAYHLAQVTALAHLWAARFRVRALAEVGVGMVLFGLGALPYVLRFFPARDNLSDPTLLPLVRRHVPRVIAEALAAWRAHVAEQHAQRLAVIRGELAAMREETGAFADSAARWSLGLPAVKVPTLR